MGFSKISSQNKGDGSAVSPGSLLVEECGNDYALGLAVHVLSLWAIGFSFAIIELRGGLI